MTPDVVHGVLWSAGVYAAIGVLVGVPFLIFGIGRIDHAAEGAPWSFRVLVLPGVVALWPVMMRRWWAARKTP